jgi:hypothetical protein
VLYQAKDLKNAWKIMYSKFLQTMVIYSCFLLQEYKDMTIYFNHVLFADLKFARNSANCRCIFCMSKPSFCFGFLVSLFVSHCVCSEQDPDDTLKRKTFELLYKMTKSTNVEVIVDRMIEYMINITDHHYKTEIASRCVELAEQFAPSNQWFIQVTTWMY